MRVTTEALAEIRIRVYNAEVDLMGPVPPHRPLEAWATPHVGPMATRTVLDRFAAEAQRPLPYGFTIPDALLK